MTEPTDKGPEASPKAEADRAAAAITARLLAPVEGLRGPPSAWYAAGFVALVFGVVALYFMRPPPPGLEPELLAPVPLLRNDPPASDAPATLDASAYLWRHALEVRTPRLPTDSYAAVVLIDGSDQHWLAQRGDRPDPACRPGCDKIELRVELDQLTPGPFRVAVVVSPHPIRPIELERWLAHGADAPPRGFGVRAWAVTRVQR